MADELSSQTIEKITDALAAGNKIEAIKIYREATGKGLKESKDFVDALIPRLKQQDPERFARLSESQTVGCGTNVVLLTMLASAAWWGLMLLL